MSRILVVDDNEQNVYYMRALLGGNGHEVNAAPNGAQALVTARDWVPDLVVSDLLMPVMDGYGLLRQWKADPLLRRVPFMVYTATYTEPRDEELAMALGADAFIVKPAEPEALLERIRQVLDTASAHGPKSGARLPGDDQQLMRSYNQTLIRKLEEKALELQAVNQSLQHDIARRRLVEAALRESEERFRQIAENIHEVFWITDAERTQLLYVSRAYERIWGRSCDSLYLEPASWLNAVHPQDRERVRQAAPSREAPIGYDQLYRIVRPDGVVRTVHDRAFPVLDEQGAVYRIVGIAEDVTEREEARHALLAREQDQRDLAAQLERERARLLVAQAVAKVGSWETDLETGLVAWSLETHRIFETTPETYAPSHQSFLSRTHPEDRARVDEAFQRSVRDGSDGTIDHRVVLPDGRVKFVQERWQVVPRETGEPWYAIGTCQDITDRVQLEERLRESQRLESVGQLTGGLAHDFNNLLTVILGNAEALQEMLAGDARAQPLAAMVVAAGERGAELTRRLLAFARKQTLEPQAVDLNRLVVGMDPLLRRTLGGHIEIEFVPATQLWAALVDPTQLDNALLNLCLNSRDAMPEGGRLTIETANVQLDEEYAARQGNVAPGDYVMLAVTDTGTGIAPEHLGRVFEPFFTTKGIGKGTGLGLATTYGFVKQSGGHLAIYAEPGQGTTVRLYLPRAQGEAAPARPASPPGPVTGGHEAVLLVEDDESVRRHARDQLAGLGYHVIEAVDCAQALAVLRTAQPVDLLFTDVVMPGMSGRELAEAARALRPQLRVLYTSGYTERALHRHGRLQPHVLLLTKPYRREDLARRVREALEGPPR